jgi:hypothetical protein
LLWISREKKTISRSGWAKQAKIQMYGLRAYSAFDKHNIGYAFWPMKKIDNIAGITNVKITPEYRKLLDYWKNGGEKPSKEYAKKALMDC